MNLHLKYFILTSNILFAASAVVAQERPADIVTPINAAVIANKITPADARKFSRIAYEKPTPQNSIMIFVDHQIGLMASTRDF